MILIDQMKNLYPTSIVIVLIKWLIWLLKVCVDDHFGKTASADFHHGEDLLDDDQDHGVDLLDDNPDHGVDLLNDDQGVGFDLPYDRRGHHATTRCDFRVVGWNNQSPNTGNFVWPEGSFIELFLACESRQLRQEQDFPTSAF